MATQVASVFAKIGADTSGLDKGLKQTEKKLGGIGGVAKSALGGVGALMGPLGLAGGIAGAGALIGKSIKEAASFESAINTLKVAVGNTGPSVKELGKAALQMGADTQLVGIDAMQSATAMENFAKAGLSAADMFGGPGGLNKYLKEGKNLSGALRAAVDLAAASELDLASASDVITIAMATFGISAEDAIKITDNFVKAADASVTSVPELAAALSNVGPTFAAFGWGLDDVNTGLALLSQRGISGSEAGTALKSMMTNMMRQTPAVTGALEALNVELYDQEGKMRELPDIIGQLEAGLSGLSEEERNMRIQTIAGTYGMKAMNTLLAEGAVGWHEMEGATANAASAQQVAEARTQGLDASMEALQGSIQTLMIRAGTPLIKHVLTPMVGWLANVIGKIAMVDFGALGTTIKTFVTGAGASAVTTFNSIKTAIGNIPTALEAARTGAEEGGLVGGASAFLTAMGVPDDIVTTLETRVASIKKKRDELVLVAQGVGTMLSLGGVSNATALILKTLGVPPGIALAISTRVLAIETAAKGLITKIETHIASLEGEGLGDTAAKLLTSLGIPAGIATTVGTTITAVETEITKLSGVVADVKAGVEESGFVGGATALLTAIGLPATVTTSISGRMTSIKTEIDKLPGYVAAVKLAAELGGFKSGTEAFLQVIGLPASTAIDIAARLTAIKTELEKLPGHVETVVSTISEKGFADGAATLLIEAGLPAGTVTAVQTRIKAVGDELAKLGDHVSTAVTTVQEKGWAEGATTLLADIGLPTTVPTSVQTRITEVGDAFKALAGHVETAVTTVGEKGFVDGALTLLANAGLPVASPETVRGRVTAIGAAFKELPGHVETVVSTISEKGFSDGATSLLIDVGLPAGAVTTVQARITEVGDALKELPGHVETMVSTLKEKGFAEGAATLLAEIGIPATVATSLSTAITTIKTELDKLPAAIETAVTAVQEKGFAQATIDLLASIGIDDTTASTIGTVGGQVVTAITTFGTDLATDAGAAWTKIKGGDALGGILDLGVMLAKMRTDAIATLLTLGDDILTTIETNFPVLKPVIDGLLKPVLDIGADVFDAIIGIKAQIIAGGAQLATDLESGLGEDEIDIGELIFGGLTGVTDLLTTITGDVLPLIETFATDIRKFLNDEFKVLIEWFVDNLPLINTTLDTLKQKWDEVWPTLSTVMSVELELIQGIIDVALKGVLGLVTAAMYVVNGEWGKAWDAIKDTGVDIGDSTRKAFEEMEKAAEKSFGGIEKQRAKFGDLHHVTAVAGDIDPANIAKLQADLSATLHPVTSVDPKEFTPPIEAIGVAWEGAKTKADEYVTAIEGWADGLVTEIETAGTAIGTFTTEKLAAMKTSLGEAKTKIDETGVAAGLFATKQLVTLKTAFGDAKTAVGAVTTDLGKLKDEIETGLGVKLTWVSDTALPAVTTAFDDAKLLVFQTIEILQALKDEITTGIGAKLDTLKGKLDPIKQGFDGIKTAVNALLTPLQTLGQRLGVIKTDPMITPGSPTPLEVGFRGIADAVLLVSRQFLKMAGSLDASRLKKIGGAFKDMSKGIDKVVGAMAKMREMGAMGGGAGGGLALGGIEAMWDQFEQVAHFVMGKIASIVDAMGGTKWGARRIKELRKSAKRLREIIEAVMVDLSSIKVYDLSNIGAWGTQLYDASTTMLGVLYRLRDEYGEKALATAANLATSIQGVMGLLGQGLEFELNKSANFAQDIATFVGQIKTATLGADSMGGLVGWLGNLDIATRRAISQAAKVAVDVKSLVGLLGMSLKIEELQEGWAEMMPQFLGRMETATNLLVPMLDRLHIAWGQAAEGAKSLLEQGSITAGHVAGVLTLMSQKLEVGEIKEGFLGALQTHLDHVGMALTKIVPALEWIRTHFVSELDPEANRLDEVQGIAAKITTILGVMGAGLKAEVPAEGFLSNLQGYLNHMGMALTKVVPALEWVRDHFVSKVDPAISRLDEVQGVASKVTNVLGVLGQSLKFELPDAVGFGGQLDKFLGFMETAADKTITMVKKLRTRWDPNATADSSVLGQLSQAAQDVQGVLGILGIDFWKGGEGLGFAESSGVLEQEVGWLLDDIGLATDMIMDPEKGLPAIGDKWGDALKDVKGIAESIKGVFDAIAGAVKSASEAMATGLDATKMGKLITSLAQASEAAAALTVVPQAAIAAGPGGAVGPSPVSTGGPGGATGAPSTEHVVKLHFMDGEHLLQEITLRLADILQTDQDLYIDAALQGAMH